MNPRTSTMGVPSRVTAPEQVRGQFAAERGMMFVKRQIVGTRLGLLAKQVRNKSCLMSAKRQDVGTCANDQIAEILVTRLCERWFVDVGAHIGSVIAEVRAHRPAVKITAFEPMCEKAAHLRRKFKDVDVIACALADTEGERKFYICPCETGYSSLARSDKTTNMISVPVRRLDTLVDGADTIKIDVEGAELGVLQGAERLTSRPLFMFESGPQDVLGYTKRDLWAWFEAHNYSIFLPSRVAHDAPPMSLEVFVDSHHYPRRAGNYFAIAAEKIEIIRNKARAILTS